MTSIPIRRAPIRRALISVYDKTGLEDLASGLHAAGVEIVSTGSTAARIAAAGVPVTPVEELTGFPECLDGRVKTLHPRVHAGLLADTANAAHQAQLAELGIEPFQLLVSNLYPFEATVASGASPEECVEQIDIGGPSMVRAAAKNHGSVAVVIEPSRYADVLAALAEGGFTLDQRRHLAAEAFAHTAAYDVAVASWFASGVRARRDRAGRRLARGGGGAVAARRRAALRREPAPARGPVQRHFCRTSRAGRPGRQAMGIAAAELLHGKAMSYNNYVDADAARRAAYDFAEPCVAIIKHSNPCGIAIGADLADAHAKAHACDPVSAFGGVIAANGPVTAGAGPADRRGVHRGGDRARLRRRGAGHPVREQERPRCSAARGAAPPRRPAPRPVEWRQVSGGILVQSADRVDEPGDDPANWQLKAGDPVSPAQLADLAFAWKACRSVKSNAILLASGGASVGVGMGQVNRVDSARLAVMRAGDRAAGSVAASDAYFPFPDGFEVLVQAGVVAVVEPGGSIRDHLTIAAAEAAGIPLYFTGVRHFYH